MKRRLRSIAFLALALGLTACGPARKSVFPPTVSIQEMSVRPNGVWHLTLRIQNNSYGEMDFKSIDGQLQVANGIPVRLHATFELDIPALSGDVLPLDVLPTPEMSQALAAIAGKGSAGSLAYDIDGRATAKPEQEKQPRDFEFHGNDWLSPVPGIANTYR
jgi:predicted small lipoprotein YifL